jgi:hypothetical protein
MVRSQVSCNATAVRGDYKALRTRFFRFANGGEDFSGSLLP